MNNKHFNLMKSAINSVINSTENLNSIFICSRGGLSKTTTTVNLLKASGKEFVYISSYSTPVEFVNFIYKNKGKIIVFDDFESIWTSGVKMINILKACLWGVGSENKRIVSYLTTDKRLTAPAQFEFSGKLIFLLNKIPKNNDSILGALLSRALVYEMNIPYKDTIEILRSFIEKDYKTIKKAERKEILDFLLDNTDESYLDDLNFRTLIKLYDLYLTNPTNWKDLSFMVFKRDENIYILKKYLSETKSVFEAQKKFTKETGLSRATFFRHKAKLGLKNV